MRRPFDLGLSSLDEDGAAVGFADVFGSVTPWAIPQITTLTAFERTIRHRPNRASTPKTRRHSSPARRANQSRFSDLAFLTMSFEPPKSRARKIEFRVAVQGDLGRPVLRAKIIRFP